MKSTKKPLQELIDNAKKHQKAFTSEYLDTARDSRQFWHMLDKVTGKKPLKLWNHLRKRITVKRLITKKYQTFL